MVRGVSCDCVRASLEPNRAHCVRRNRPPIICEAINWTNPGGILLTLRRINVPPAVFNALRIMAIKGDHRINSGRTSTLWQNKQKASLSRSLALMYTYMCLAQQELWLQRHRFGLFVWLTELARVCSQLCHCFSSACFLFAPLAINWWLRSACCWWDAALNANDALINWICRFCASSSSATLEHYLSLPSALLQGRRRILISWKKNY